MGQGHPWFSSSSSPALGLPVSHMAPQSCWLQPSDPSCLPSTSPLCPLSQPRACMPASSGQTQALVGSGKFLIYPVITIWEDPRARVSISQKAVWSFLGTWSPSQRQGHSQAQGWPGGGSGFTIADQSPPGRERTGNAPCPVPLGDLWDP